MDKTFAVVIIVLIIALAGLVSLYSFPVSLIASAISTR